MWYSKEYILIKSCTKISKEWRKWVTTKTFTLHVKAFFARFWGGPKNFARHLRYIYLIFDAQKITTANTFISQAHEFLWHFFSWLVEKMSIPAHMI